MLTQFEMKFINTLLSNLSRLKGMQHKPKSVGPLRSVLQWILRKTIKYLTTFFVSVRVGNLYLYVCQMHNATTQTRVLMLFIITCVCALILVRISSSIYGNKLVNLLSILSRSNIILRKKNYIIRCLAIFPYHTYRLT